VTPRRPAAPAANRSRLSPPAVAELLVWALVVLVPLVLVTTARDPFGLPKRLVAEWLALASVLVLAAGAAWRGGRRWSVPGVRELPAVRLVLPLLAAAVVSWALTVHRAHAATAMADLAIACVALVAWSGGLEGWRLRRALTVLAVPAALLAAVGILQFHGVYRLFSFQAGLEASRYGVTSLAGNAGQLGAFLAFACVVMQALLPRSRAGWPRILLLAAIALGLYGVVVSETLTALAGVLLGSAVVWANLLPRRRFALAVALAVAVAAMAVVAVAPLRDRVTSKAQELAAGRINAVLTGRLDGWRAALWMVGEHPVAGVGPGAYVSEFGTAKLALLDRGVPFYPSHVQPVFANAHNELLEVAAEWGVLGVAALLWALWVVVAAVRRIGRGADAALARGGLAVLVVLSLTHFPFRLALTGYPALLWLAWTLRRSREGAADDVAAVDGAPAVGGKVAAPSTAGRVLAWTVVVLLAAALALQTVRAQRLLRASRILNAVERTTVQMAARGQLPPTLLWANLRLLREAGRLDPSSVGVVIAAGGEHLLLAQPEEAEQVYRQALELEPRPEVWLNLGRAQWSRQERAAAVASWTTAVRLAPRMIGQVPAPARQQVHRAAQRSPGWSGDASRGAGDGR